MIKKKKFEPFDNLVLDEYEKEIEKELEKDHFKRVDNYKEESKMIEEAASRHVELRESKKVTIRLNKGDLIKVKAKAKRNNIPYQTLINLLINKFAKGEVKIAI